MPPTLASPLAAADDVVRRIPQPTGFWEWVAGGLQHGWLNTMALKNTTAVGAVVSFLSFHKKNQILFSSNSSVQQ